MDYLDFQNIDHLMDGPQIEFKNVTKLYPNGVKALDNVSFKVESGEFAFLMGHSGSGKSSLIKLLMLEEKASSGDIIVSGINLSDIKPAKVPYYRRSMGVVFQDFRIIPSKSVYENVAFALELCGYKRSEINERVHNALELVGLEAKVKEMPRHLSGGEQQRVAIARAVVNRPGLIIADEPTGNLDPTNSELIMSYLKKINCMGATVIVATHEAEFVKKTHERIISLSQGVKLEEN